jgi:hypothetical protein
MSLWWPQRDAAPGNTMEEAIGREEMCADGVYLQVPSSKMLTVFEQSLTQSVSMRGVS